jgi:3-oxoacyl-[acyl-carrier protein] reductase
MSNLNGKVALVTGCGNPHGMGRATALRLAQAGARVVVTDICRTDDDLALGGALMLGDDFGALEALAKEIGEAGGEALAHPLDLTQDESIAAALAATHETFGGLDLLVNNAGTAAGLGDFLEIPDEQWALSFQVNVLGLVRICRRAIPMMKKRGGGAIVNNASAAGLGGKAGYGAYAAMKHAVVGITKTLADEFAAEGIRCNCVCPGNIHTDMGETEAAMVAEELGISRDEALAQLGSESAFKRMGQPEEVADAIVYLSSDASSFLTGVALPVTGGMSFGI